MIESLWKYIRQNKGALLLTALLVVLLVSFFPEDALASYRAKCDIKDYQEAGVKCWFCPLFATIFNAVSQIAGLTYNKLASAIQGVVLVGMAMWIAFLIIQHVSKWETKDARQFLKALLNQCFVALMVFLFLGMGSEKFMKLFIEPIFSTGFNLVYIVLETSKCGPSELVKAGGMPRSMGDNIVCTIGKIQEVLRNVMALGTSSMCVGMFVAYWKIPILFSHWGYVLIGLLLYIAGLAFLVIFPFLLIDTVLQMGVAVSLMPAAIGCYAFKITHRYVWKCFDSIMNAMFTFVFLAIIIFIFTEQINNTVGPAIVTAVGDGSNVFNSKFLDELSWSGIAFLQMIFLMLLGWAVLGQAAVFAGTFSNFGGGGFTDQMGGMGSKTGGLAASAGNKIGGAALKMGKAGFGKVKTFAGNRIKSGISTMRNNITRRRMEKHGTQDADGNLTLTTNKFGIVGNLSRKLTGVSFKSNQVTRTIAAGQGKNATIVKTRQGGWLNRKTFITTRNNDMKQTIVKNKDGDIIRKGRVKILSARGKELTNFDGSVNTDNIREFMENAPSQEMASEAILHRLIKDQMPGIGTGLSGKNKESKFSVTTNDKGNMVMTINQLNKDGSRAIVSSELSAKGRALTTITQIDKRGRAELKQTDGICNRRATFAADKDGNAVGEVRDYTALTKYYQGYAFALDRNGRFSDKVPIQDSMVPSEGIKKMQNRMIRDGKYYDMEGFK